ncbi:unnamed protein product [Alternaria alternata]
MTWTPPWTAKEMKALVKLQERNENREKELNKIFGKLSKTSGTDSRPYKWNWRNKAPEAAKIVEDAQEDAADYQEMLEKELARLYTWPSPDLTDGKIFLPGKGVFATFNRKDTWFDDMGFSIFQTDYTFSDNWDKERMPVTILVPNDLPVGHKAPVMWFFHGGGYCTGAGGFPAWYSQTTISRAKAKKAIIIAPDYPLGPEGNYKDIVDCLRDFLVWYKEDGCFESDFTKWTEWLYKQKPLQKFTIDKDHVYVEGESAGGQAAVTALWLNAAKGGPNLPIDVALLRYPMIAHYKRKWDECADKENGKVNYMGLWFTKEEVLKREADIAELIKWLESHNLLPTCSSRWPSKGMAFAFILSVTEKWQCHFQRQHDFPKAKRDEIDYMDGIQRANNTQSRVSHERLPPMYIFHGWNDPNCPVEDTEKFVKVLRTKYPERYNNNKNLRFNIVKKLAVRKFANPDGSIIIELDSDKVMHGFDYWLDESEEKFLRDAYDWVSDRWKSSS